MANKKKIQGRIACELLKIKQQIVRTKVPGATPAKQDKSQVLSTSQVEEKLPEQFNEQLPEQFDEQLKEQFNEQLKERFCELEQITERVNELEKTNKQLLLEMIEGKQTMAEIKENIYRFEEQVRERISKLEKDNKELRHEITAYKQNTELLWQKTSTTNFSDDAVIETTLDGVILNWNLRAAELYGYSAEEVKGFPFFILVPRERYEELKDITKQVGLGEEFPQSENTFVRKDGKQIEVIMKTCPIKDESGQIIGISIITKNSVKRECLVNKVLQA